MFPLLMIIILGSEYLTELNLDLIVTFINTNHNMNETQCDLIAMFVTSI